MTPCLLGTETEYALTVLRPEAGLGSGSNCGGLMVQIARETLPHLPGGQCSGIFLLNGSRLYEDSGSHPEIGSCEVSNPWDACRYALAGDRIMLQLAREYERRHAGREVIVSRCNVDYLSGVSWGMHESFLHRTVSGRLHRQLLPFLATRCVFMGAGGLNPFSQGIQFVLSPRAYFFKGDVSSSSTHDRGLYHTKNETLTGGSYNRLHVLGESTCSELATWLKMGTTALVLAVIDAGISPAESIRFESAVRAYHEFAADPTCTVTVGTQSGQHRSAIDVQRAYLRTVKDHVGKSFMPIWADAVCERWEAVLETLQSGAPESASCSLDWAIKYALYGNVLQKHGCSWERAVVLSQTVNDLSRAASVYISHDKPLTASFVRTICLERQDLLGQACRNILKRAGTDLDEVQRFIELRQKLIEIERRFSQLGDKGIFNAMDRAGVLDHHVPGVENIEHAVTHPPGNSRASLRGRLIKKLAKVPNGRYGCDWDAIRDRQERRTFDLSDPFGRRARWRDMTSDEEESLDIPFPMGNPQLGEYYRQYVRRRRERRASEAGNTA